MRKKKVQYINMWQIIKIYLNDDNYSETVAGNLKLFGADGVSEEWNESDGFFVKGFWYEGHEDEIIEVVGKTLDACVNAGIFASRPIYELSKIQDNDWLIGWKQYFSPFEVSSRLFVTPSWEQSVTKTGQEVIILDPGMAFGTGTHGTTYTCLQALSDNLLPGHDVCDIGTGSGILAFAAKKLGAATVYATDNDSLAIKVARENEKVNGLEGEIEFAVEDLFSGEKKYDLVIANILAPIIQELTPKIPLILKPNGIFISSGYIVAQKSMIHDCLTENRFDVKQEYEREGWVTIVAALNE